VSESGESSAMKRGRWVYLQSLAMGLVLTLGAGVAPGCDPFGVIPAGAGTVSQDFAGFRVDVNVTLSGGINSMVSLGVTVTTAPAGVTIAPCSVSFKLVDPDGSETPLNHPGPTPGVAELPCGTRIVGTITLPGAGGKTVLEFDQKAPE
jgi:hypothetical protein